MPTKKPSEDWIDAIRVSMREFIRNRKWQLIKNKGKARFGIRFENGKRTYKYLPHKWLGAICVGLKSIKFKSFIDHPFELKKYQT